MENGAEWGTQLLNIEDLKKVKIVQEYLVITQNLSRQVVCLTQLSTPLVVAPMVT